MKTHGMRWGLSVMWQGRGLLLSQGQGCVLPPVVLKSYCPMCARGSEQPGVPLQHGRGETADQVEIPDPALCSFI